MSEIETDPDGFWPSVSRVWLLEPDGTPTGESQWDRRLRVDGRTEVNGTSTQLWLTLLDGERGLWHWVVMHLLRERRSDLSDLNDLRGVVWPIGVEMWSATPKYGWVRWQLPRIQPWEPIHKVPDLNECPILTWHGWPNPNWRDERFRDKVLAWETVPSGRPSEAPPPLTDAEARTA